VIRKLYPNVSLESGGDRPDPGEAYDAIADGYDLLTAGYAHDAWLDAIERLARRHGLHGRRVLDVACGTGKSFLPLRARGYSVVGCDVSEAMLAHAAAKAPGVPLHRADMRALPRLGRFDLVTCLDDALNYVLEEVELVACLRGLARNLARGGLAVWDVNTLATHRGAFAADRVCEDDERLIVWRGRTPPDLAACGLAEARVDHFVRSGCDWRRLSARHLQRNWPVTTIARLAREAGLHVAAVHGQHPGAVLDDGVDELVHTKALFVARAAPARRGRR
jgi:SAM-dependent methyltransferase